MPRRPGRRPEARELGLGDGSGWSERGFERCFSVFPRFFWIGWEPVEKLANKRLRNIFEACARFFWFGRRGRGWIAHE